MSASGERPLLDERRIFEIFAHLGVNYVLAGGLAARVQGATCHARLRSLEGAKGFSGLVRVGGLLGSGLRGPQVADGLDQPGEGDV